MDAGAISVERHGDHYRIRLTGTVTPQTVGDLRALTLHARYTELDATRAHVPPEAAELLRDWQVQDRHGLTLHLLLPSGADHEEDGDALPVDVPDLLAHELRSPLTMAHLRLQTLAGRLAGLGHPAEAAECQRILGSLQHLSGLLETYVAASGSWDFTPLDLRTLCAGLADARAEQLGLGPVRVVTGPSPVWVRGEARALAQTLWNLVRNGLEAGAPDGEVTVAVEATPDRGIAEVVVSDRGPGFPADMLAAPPSRYRTSKPEGMGVGLAICRWILHRHGGALQLANRDGGGQARVILPLAKPAAR